MRFTGRRRFTPNVLIYKFCTLFLRIFRFRNVFYLMFSLARSCQDFPMFDEALVSFFIIIFPKIKSIFLPYYFFHFLFDPLNYDGNEYSATEGADSHPASGSGTPTDDKAGQVGMGKL